MPNVKDNERLVMDVGDIARALTRIAPRDLRAQQRG
jgi:hypothetical protein